MFSRTDFDRVRRLPLLWVWGPLLGGTLVVVAITVALRASEGFPDIELGAEIERAAYERSSPTMLRDVTDFRWDRVCVIPSHASRDEVDATLGFDWGAAGGPGYDDEVLLVFVREQEVQAHAFVPRAVLEPPPDGGDCAGPDDPRTALTGQAPGS